MRGYPGPVTVYVDGVAASAASVIAMAGDQVVMASSSMIMVHDALTCTIGDEADHLAVAALLGQASGVVAEIYASRAGGSASQWRDTMRNETWFTAPEAVEAGLADRIADTAPTARTTTSAVRTSSTGRIAANLRAGLRPTDLVGFQNSTAGVDLQFQAVRSYSLIRPPRMGRRLIRWLARSGTA